MYRLQEIRIDRDTGDEEVRKLYYTGNAYKENGCTVVPDGETLDFFTYFGSLSVEKWQKYTFAESFCLILEIEGEFELEFVGGYSADGRKAAFENFGGHVYRKNERVRLELALPTDVKSKVIGFWLRSVANVRLYRAFYAATVKEERIQKPMIAITTTTFRKEAYIMKNMEQLERELFSDNEYKDGFCWNIIDNGRTLTAPESDHIRVFANANLGGAGGFARGMIEATRSKKALTHILLMDDDVKISTDSLKRLYDFLRIVRPEYAMYFISGAMLKMGQPSIQHEDVGTLIPEGYHRPVKRKLNMAKPAAFVKNEGYSYDEDAHNYAAWWFCCIPMSFIRTDNLPIPVFVRGDDMEFSLRNHARFITMNGFCVWHEGFEGKFSTAMEFYQTQRNIWIVTALHDELSDVDVHRRFVKMFRQELRKFDYKGAGFLLDALEDYLKGPDFLIGLNGEESIRQKREADYVAEPMPFAMRKELPKKKELYKRRKLTGIKSILFEITDNGQKWTPDILTGRKTGQFPFEYEFYPNKQYMTVENFGLGVENDTYTILRKDKGAYRRLLRRFTGIEELYRSRNEQVKQQYKDKFREMTGISFWEKYLQMEGE